MGLRGALPGFPPPLNFSRDSERPFVVVAVVIAAPFSSIFRFFVGLVLGEHASAEGSGEVGFRGAGAADSESEEESESELESEEAELELDDELAFITLELELEPDSSLEELSLDSALLFLSCCFSFSLRFGASSSLELELWPLLLPLSSESDSSLEELSLEFAPLFLSCFSFSLGFGASSSLELELLPLLLLLFSESDALLEEAKVWLVLSGEVCFLVFDFNFGSTLAVDTELSGI